MAYIFFFRSIKRGVKTNSYGHLLYTLSYIITQKPRIFMIWFSGRELNSFQDGW